MTLITLGHTYKIIAKILINILKKVLHLIISFEKDIFVKGRQIIDEITTMHEILHSLNSGKDEGILIKLNIQKAYDRVN